MIVGEHRDQVIANIQEAVKERDFYRKVEVDDPELTKEELSALLAKHSGQQYSLGFTTFNLTARFCTWVLTRVLNWNTRVEGLENLTSIHGGAIVTSNHFSPLDNLVVRKAIYRGFHQRLFIVSQDSNLAMKGFLGFLMNFLDIVPISNNVKYMNDYFGPKIKDLLRENQMILIYPEQEMWFNYRKVRPPKRGPYYYAARNMVPVISCFVEIQTRKRKEREDFYKTRYIMHVLPPIYPDPQKNVKENSHRMMEIDYEQKKEAYEQAYNRPLTYDFEKGDIAGYVPLERDI